MISSKKISVQLVKSTTFFFGKSLSNSSFRIFEEFAFHDVLPKTKSSVISDFFLHCDI